MLTSRDEFVSRDEECLAICGLHFGPGAVHVGIYWHSENEKKIFHFQAGDDIRLQDATLPEFNNYLFAKVDNFNLGLLPLLTATAIKIAKNTFNGFEFRRQGAFYDGGKFEFVNGAWTGKTGAEKFINCGVFVFAFLQSFECTLINWGSWPNADGNAKDFLELWLNLNNVPFSDHIQYYNKTKIVRGKHIIVSPITETKPSPFKENDPLATSFFG